MTEHDHDHCHGEAMVTPEADAAIARKALAEGDLKHALFHVAGALSVQPDEPRYLALLEEVLASVDDPVALAETEPGASYMLFAVKAWAWRRAGRATDAAALLVRVLETRPDSPYGGWLRAWIADAALEPAPVSRAIDVALSNLDKTDLGRRYGDHARALFLDALTTLRAREPAAADTNLALGRLLRVLRRYDEAMAIAQAEDERAPTYRTALLLGTIERERGARAEAVPWFRRAAERDPSDFAIHLDIGDTLLGLGDFAAAIAAYEAALARDPGNAWASASIPYARFRASGALADREAVEAYAAARPDDGRAQGLVARVTPFLGYLPEPNEACLGVVGGLWRGEIDSPPVRMASTSLESPSALAAADEALAARGFAPPSRTVSRPLDPDVRVPLARTAFVLWGYDDITATPAVPPPSDEVAAAVAELARRSFSAVAWAREAEAIAGRLGPAAIPDLLASTVHPPPWPDGWAPWHWRQQVALAAPLIIALSEEGWAESGRRAALHSLLFGILDWTTTGGIVAMTELAFRGGAPRDEALAWFAELERIPESPSAYGNVMVPLVECMLQLPFLPAERREILRARRRGLLAT